MHTRSAHAKLTAGRNNTTQLRETVHYTNISH